MLDADSRRISLHRRLDNTQDALDAIRRRKEAMAAPAQSLLARADELVAFARSALDERWLTTESFPEQGRQLVRTIACDDLLRLLQELSATLLPALRGANSSRIPVELTAALEDAVTDAMGGTSLSVVVYAAPAYNYSIQYYGDPLVELAPLIAPFAPSPTPGPDAFLFLSLPELERDSATLHAIVLGHEIGHLRDWRSQITAGLNVPIPTSWLDAAGAPKPEYLDAVPFFRATVASWAQELVSDIFAALVLGPASLLALIELLSNVTAFTSDSHSHPGGDRRLLTVLAVLGKLGVGALPDLLPTLTPLEKMASTSVNRPVRVTGHTERGPAMQEAADSAWAWLQTQVPALTAACEAVVSKPYRAQDWSEAQWAADQLDRGRPCGERVTDTPSGPELQSLSPADVLNGAWLARLRRHPGLAIVLRSGTSPGELAQLDAVVDGLVLKSLEIAAVRAETPWA